MIALAIVLAIGVGCMLFFLIGGTAYSKTGWAKGFFHDVLGWHEPNKNTWYDGASFHSRCKHCGKTITQDGQGNWF